MPAGWYFLISSREAVQGRTTEKTFSSRMRRAINCVYCEPKSRITMDCSSTNDFPRFKRACKEQNQLTADFADRRGFSPKLYLVMAVGRGGERCFWHRNNGRSCRRLRDREPQ